MTTHTPGPWVRVHKHPDESTRASLAYIYPQDNWSRNEIATVYGCDHNDQQAANANLIAAAPDLLAAAKALIALQDQTDPEGLFRSYEGTALRAAIAKAEGRS